MVLETLTQAILNRARSLPKIGSRVKFDLGRDGIILWNGTSIPPEVTNQDGDAEATVVISAANLRKLLDGKLDPTLAFVQGKLKVRGSMGLAMKLGNLLET